MTVKNVIWAVSSQAPSQPIALANTHTHAPVTLPSSWLLFQSHSETPRGGLCGLLPGRWGDGLGEPCFSEGLCGPWLHHGGDVPLDPSSLSSRQKWAVPQACLGVQVYSYSWIYGGWLLLSCFFNFEQSKTFSCMLLVSLVIRVFKTSVSLFWLM